MLVVAIMVFCATAASSAASYDDFVHGMSADNLGQNDEAIAAFTAAISAGDLSPNLLPAAYRGRAVANYRKHHCADALADLDVGLKLKPGDVPLTVAHAYAEMCLSKLDAADADLSALIAARPDADLYKVRGRLRLVAGRAASATDDFAAAVKSEPGNPYTTLWLELTRLRGGTLDAVTAQKDISDFHLGRWPGPLLSLYAGAVRPEDIAVAAARGEADDLIARKCEADFYLGEWWLGRGDIASAKPLLQHAADTCPQAFVEYDEARAELGRMK